MNSLFADKLRAWLSSVLLVGVLSGCGNLTAGGFGEAEVYASGDADESPTPAPPTPSSDAPQGAPGPLGAGAGMVEGTLEATLALALIDEDGSVVSLSGASASVAQLELDGGNTPLVVERLIPAARYAALRIRFIDVSANVLAGLVIGGVPYIGPVTVDIGATAFEVLVPITFDLDQGGRVALLLDLNADEWLLTLNALTQTVTAENFGSSINVVIR